MTEPCTCVEFCGDTDDGIGTCKWLPRSPEPPLVEVVLVPRSPAPAPDEGGAP